MRRWWPYIAGSVVLVLLVAVTLLLLYTNRRSGISAAEWMATGVTSTSSPTPSLTPASTLTPSLQNTPDSAPFEIHVIPLGTVTPDIPVMLPADRQTSVELEISLIDPTFEDIPVTFRVRGGGYVEPDHITLADTPSKIRYTTGESESEILIEGHITQGSYNIVQAQMEQIQNYLEPLHILQAGEGAPLTYSTSTPILTVKLDLILANGQHPNGIYTVYLEAQNGMLSHSPNGDGAASGLEVDLLQGQGIFYFIPQADIEQTLVTGYVHNYENVSFSTMLFRGHPASILQVNAPTYLPHSGAAQSLSVIALDTENIPLEQIVKMSYTVAFNTSTQPPELIFDGEAYPPGAPIWLQSWAGQAAYTTMHLSTSWSGVLVLILQGGDNQATATIPLVAAYNEALISQVERLRFGDIQASLSYASASVYDPQVYFTAHYQPQLENPILAVFWVPGDFVDEDHARLIPGADGTIPIITSRYLYENSGGEAQAFLHTDGIPLDHLWVSPAYTIVGGEKLYQIFLPGTASAGAAVLPIPTPTASHSPAATSTETSS